MIKLWYGISASFLMLAACSDSSYDSQTTVDSVESTIQRAAPYVETTGEIIETVGDVTNIPMLEVVGDLLDDIGEEMVDVGNEATEPKKVIARKKTITVDVKKHVTGPAKK